MLVKDGIRGGIQRWIEGEDEGGHEEISRSSRRRRKRKSRSKDRSRRMTKSRSPVSYRRRGEQKQIEVRSSSQSLFSANKHEEKTEMIQRHAVNE
mmetsp:Transcript_37077/g.72933  ORF Transcript_37077/g.72933 Transcript_37077/m.72933 type:complete len:95 (-) Transcript_37077:93-377(-)